MSNSALIAASVALLASAAAMANESVYTDLDLDRCQITEQIEEGESVSWDCPGHATIPLLVSSGDGRFDIDAGVRNDEWETLPQFNNPGPRVEWRMDGRVALAVIFRLRSADSEHPGAALFVETVGRPDAPGCTVAVIDARLPNANRLARDIADRRAAGFRCGTDTAERHSLD